MDKDAVLYKMGSLFELRTGLPSLSMIGPGPIDLVKLAKQDDYVINDIRAWLASGPNHIFFPHFPITSAVDTKLQEFVGTFWMSHPSTSPPATADEENDPSVSAFSDLINQHVARVFRAAETIGGQVLDVTILVRDAFVVQKELLIKLKQSQKPDLAGLVAFLKPLNEVFTKASTITEGRRYDFFNHLKVGSDSLSALAWIDYTGKYCGMSMPIAHVEENWQMAEFYSNKVLVKYRNKDLNHVEWVKALRELYLPRLRDYVKAFHPLGPDWNPRGKPITASKSFAHVAPAAPPPPSASLFSYESSKASSSKPKEGMSAVFDQISSGNVTSGLRKVTDDMKTKNRTNRTRVVGASEKGSHASPWVAPKVEPPKFELQMGRKVNNITIEKCTKIRVVFKDVVAACEIINSNGVEVKCQASITTAKSSEINVLVPSVEPDGDWVEHSLPQQYIHLFKDGHFETTSASYSGG
ncbi:hypothetical protein Fmac_032949 [Flemingia macrophylla]|uniref:Adenylyl cyclase-associated protein n=1 Tax=Flemingia macrophylla TaxID=520843 RepID=A0ABD1L6T8_9FABA